MRAPHPGALPSPEEPSNFSDLVDSLAAIGRSLGRVFEPRGFLREFSAQIRRMVPHDRIVIDHLDEDGRTFTVFAEHAPADLVLHAEHYTTAFAAQARYVVEEWALRPVFQGNAMLVADFLTDARFARLNQFERRFVDAGLRAGLFAPLESGGRIVGAIIVTSTTPQLYGGAHLTALQQIARILGPFIDNRILLERERRRRQRLAALTGLAGMFGTTLDILENFDRLAEAVRPHLDFDIIGVARLGANGRDWDVVHRLGDGSAPPFPCRIPLDHLSFAKRLQAGEPVLIRDVQGELDPTRPGDRAIIERGGRSGLLVPFWFSEVVDGYLFFAKRQPNWYDDSDVEIAAGVAAQLVVALQHQRLAAEQQQRARIEGQARRLEQQLASLRSELGGRYSFDQIVGRSPVLREALSRAAKVAPGDTTVLLTGESGTGKELVARAIHFASPRAAGPFVAINCAALPETLIESELFGHERGAFTGADKQKPGRFEQAGGGTLFLDEVGELPPSAQAKLLRVLQEHEFQRVGGTATLRADVRLITATNRDLARAAGEGGFRPDLYYRLNVFHVHLPPLRERGEDVLLLASRFLRELGPRIIGGEPGLSREARELLLAYPWPGNIRELANAIERALIVSEGELLSAAHFGLAWPPPQGAARQIPAQEASTGSLAEVEKQAILGALDRAKGNKSQAAAALGITRTKLYTRLKQLRIPV
jgi:transcriptional regulator with GAF, ATPase, and Fis domain